MSTPASPQYVTNHESSIVPGDTATHALFSTATPAMSAIILPLPGNTGDILVSYSATPLISAGLTLPLLANGRFHNLAALNIKAANTTDGVCVIWYT